MPKEYQRTERVADAIQREVAKILQRDIRDPRLGMTTVSAVEVSRDLAYAKIFVSVLGDEAEIRKTLDVLKGATGHIRSLLAKALSLRMVPHLSFVYDRSILHGDQLSQLINQAAESDANIKNQQSDDPEESD